MDLEFLTNRELIALVNYFIPGPAKELIIWIDTLTLTTRLVKFQEYLGGSTFVGGVEYDSSSDSAFVLSLSLKNGRHRHVVTKYGQGSEDHWV